MGKIISEVSVVLWLLLTILVAIKSDEDCDVDLENVLKLILNPNEPTLQQQALQAELIRRVKEALQREEFENQLVDYKRSISSLARWDNLPGKRNLESLARAGYIRTLHDDDSNFKRSISSLAKSGQLPFRYTNDNLKRNIQSLARNGELTFRQTQRDDYDEDYDKRNIGSVPGNFPVYKRNIASLARDGMNIYGKRNAGGILKQDNYLNNIKDENQTQKNQNGHLDDKRNIASIKAQYKTGKFKRSTNFDPFITGAAYRRRPHDDWYVRGPAISGGCKTTCVNKIEENKNQRQKRSVDYDGVEENFQDPLDYEETLKEMAAGGYENPEKRFLGRLPQMGKSKTTPSPKSRLN